eukprot:3130423-Pleurochrysis_carterae.AAC.4
MRPKFSEKSSTALPCVCGACVLADSAPERRDVSEVALFPTEVPNTAVAWPTFRLICCLSRAPQSPSAKRKISSRSDQRWNSLSRYMRPMTDWICACASESLTARRKRADAAKNSSESTEVPLRDSRIRYVGQILPSPYESMSSRAKSIEA